MPNPQEIIDQTSQDFSAWMSGLSSQDIPRLFFGILAAIVVFIIGRWLIRYFVRFSKRRMVKHGLDATAVNFFTRLLTALLITLLIILALNIIGIPTTSLVALMSVIALAVGLALQDVIGNLAAGLLIFTIRPYSETDFVEVGQERLVGTVDSIHFFHTYLRMIDNAILLVPNQNILNNPIQNFTDLQWRRIDLEFGIGYDDDLLLAKKVLQEIAAAEERVLTDPPPRIAVKELGESSVNLILQPYVAPSDYLQVKYDLTEQVKLRFDAEGITIPYPQRTIHMIGAS